MIFRIPPWLVTTDQAQCFSNVFALAVWREPCYAAIPSRIENFNGWPRIDSAECLLSMIEFVGVNGYDRDAYSIVFK